MIIIIIHSIIINNVYPVIVFREWIRGRHVWRHIGTVCVGTMPFGDDDDDDDAFWWW